MAETRALNKQQIREFIAFLEPFIHETSDTDAGMLSGLLYNDIKLRLGKYTEPLLTSGKYAAIVESAMNETVRPECRKIFEERGDRPAAVDTQLRTIIMGMGAQHERQFAEYYDFVTANREKE